MYEHLNEVHLRGIVGAVNISDVMGKTHASFALAVSVRPVEDSNTLDSSILLTTWFSVVALNSERIDAQTLRSLSKGCTVEVHGRFRMVCYVDGKGDEKRTYEVIAHRLEILSAEPE